MNLQPAIALAALLFLSACAPQSRLLQSPAADERVALGLKAGVPGNVQVTLEHVIVRDGPGSWLRDADWDEYVLRLRNEGDEPIVVEAIDLASDALATSAHSIDREALESASRRNLDTLKSVGAVVALGAGVMTLALATASVEPSVALSSIMGGGGGAAAASGLAVLAPVAIIAGGAIAYRHHARRSEDRAAIEYELDRIGFHLPVRIRPGGELRASAFFPLTPAPTRLRSRYTTHDLQSDAVIELSSGTDPELASPENPQ